MGLSWHSEKLSVLLFHPGDSWKPSIPQEPPFPAMMDASGMGTLKLTCETAHPSPTGLLPTSSHQFLCESVGYQVHIWWLNQKVQLLCPMRQAKREQSQPSTSPRHWETFCRSRERTASERFLQQTQFITQENTIAWHRVFWPRFLPGLLFGHGFLQVVQGRVRFVGRAMAYNRITIFKLFLLQPDAGCPFFPDGQPLLPKAWCAGKLNPTCSIFSSLLGWEVKSEPNVQNLKDTFCAPEVNLVPRYGWRPVRCWDSWE